MAGVTVMTNRQRWLLVATVAWVLVLVVGGYLSSRSDPATVREQVPLADATRTVEAAVAEVLAAAGPGVGAEVAAPEVTTGCRLTLAWRGAALDQVVVLTVPAGQESALLDKLVDRLPPGWGARYQPAANRFFADAGDYVAIRGGIDDEGVVRLTLSTDCRPT